MKLVITSKGFILKQQNKNNEIVQDAGSYGTYKIDQGKRKKKIFPEEDLCITCRCWGWQTRQQRYDRLSWKLVSMISHTLSVVPPFSTRSSIMPSYPAPPPALFTSFYIIAVKPTLEEN